MTKPKLSASKKGSAAAAGDVAETATKKLSKAAPRKGDKEVEIVRTEKYIEPVPVPEPEPAAAEDESPYCAACNDEGCELCEPVFLLNEPEPVKSEVDIVLEEASSNPAHKLLVHHLPNFDIDHRTDKAAELSFCTTLQPVTLDYLATVAKHWGAGNYLFELYEPGKGITKRWHKKIKGAIAEPPPQSAAVVPQIVEVQPPGSLKSELKRLRSVAEDLQELRTMMGWDVQHSAPPAASSPAPAAAEVDPLDKLLLKAAMEKPELSDKILNRVLGESDAGGGIGGIVAEAFKHPTETRAIISDVFREIRALIHPESVPPPGGNGASEPAAGSGGGSPKSPEDELEITLNIVVADLKKNKRVGRAADAIDELLLKHPKFGEMFDKLLNLTPAGFVAELSAHSGESLAEYGHAIGFVENLCDALRPPVDVSEE